MKFNAILLAATLALSANMALADSQQPVNPQPSADAIRAYIAREKVVLQDLSNSLEHAQVREKTATVYVGIDLFKMLMATAGTARLTQGMIDWRAAAELRNPLTGQYGVDATRAAGALSRVNTEGGAWLGYVPKMALQQTAIAMVKGGSVMLAVGSAAVTVYQVVQLGSETVQLVIDSHQVANLKAQIAYKQGVLKGMQDMLDAAQQ